MHRVPFPYVALIRWGVELGWGGGRETCLIAGGVPFYSPAALDSVVEWIPSFIARRLKVPLNIGFQLDSIATMGRMAMEQHGEKPVQL